MDRNIFKREASNMCSEQDITNKMSILRAPYKIGMFFICLIIKYLMSLEEFS